MGILPPIMPPKAVLKLWGKPKMGFASEMIIVTPRNIDCVPRVMMNGCSLVKLISAPLIAPSSAPTPTPPNSTARPNGMPATIIFAVTTPESASTEPTDRSIPAIKIAKNSPQAISIVVALWVRICTRLPGDKNCGGAKTEVTRIIKTKIISVPIRSQ